MNFCLNCWVGLNIIDEDLNGEKNAICAKCRAEENHNFDREPKASFNRAGQRINEK